MSQSDFIKYKKLYTELNINKKPPILSSQEYTLYKQFALENVDSSIDKIITSRLIPPNKMVIFGMEKTKLHLTNCLQIQNCKIVKL